MHSHPILLHPVVTIGPFSKWDINFRYCNTASVGGHHYIIIVIDYFTKWVEVMPTFSNHYIIIAIDYFTKWVEAMPTISNDSDIVRQRVFSEGDLVLVYD